MPGGDDSAGLAEDINCHPYNWNEARHVGVFIVDSPWGVYRELQGKKAVGDIRNIGTRIRTNMPLGAKPSISCYGRARKTG